jgi:hypothetical protein
MSRRRGGLTVVAAFVVGTHAAHSQEAPPCRPRPVNVEHASRAPESKVPVGSVCAQGSPSRFHLEARDATIVTVLAALRDSYNISYRSSIALDETRNGAYAGSLAEVMSYLLSGYDYVIKSKGSTLDVEIFGKSGAQTVVPAPAVLEVKENPVRRQARGARTH